jgi:pyruvate dehydrogenase E2 component (dihydrolipoamide acetyltransferase)
MAIEVFMPKLSDNMETGIIVSWLIKEGGRVKKGQPILEIETDKATVELEAPEGGFLKGIREGVGAGTSVSVGETIAYITAAPDEEVPILPPMGEVMVTDVHLEGQVVSHPEPAFDEEEDKTHIRATPVVRRIARELGINLNLVRGDGPGGRVTEADVRRHHEDQKKAGERQSVTKGAEIRAHLESTGRDGLTQMDSFEGEWLDLTQVQLITGQRMIDSVRNVPQFALTTRVDMTNLLDLREAESARIEAQTGVHLSITGMVIKVVANALKRFPRANASFVDGRILLHNHINMGVAVGTDQGLVVPVIRDADQKTLVEIADELKNLQGKADRMRFGPNDFTGGTFTISNLGMYGIDHFQAILNPPETAILAIGRIVKTPIGMPDDAIALRPMMNLTLSIDHRSLDGMQGAKFLTLVIESLEQPNLAVQ